MRCTSIAVAAVLACTPLTTAHSWIQQLRNVNEQGKYIGDWGYPRGYCAKGDTCDPGIINNHLLPDPTTEPGLFISDKSVLCKASQQKAEQLDASKYPRLKAVPGMHIAMRYSENGHVSLNGTPREDTNKFKPSKGGTVFVYGTTNPKEDEKLINVLKWTEDGKGGDGQGVLLSTNDFDDGRCYEANNSPIAKARAAANPSYALGQTGQGNGMFSIPCESNIEFPKTATTGKPYTLYWVWQWNTPPGLDPARPLGKDEYYTTCMDVDVVDTFKSEANGTVKYSMPQQDDISSAVKDFKDRTAIYNNPMHGEIGPIFSGNQSTPSAPGAPLASGGTPAATAPAPTDIPSMSVRPGRPQPSQSLPGGGVGNGSAGSDNGDVVTVTDIVYITVTAPGNAPSTLATAVVSSTNNASATSAALSSGDAPVPTDVPQLSSRPGRPQPQITARAFSIRGRLY